MSGRANLEQLLQTHRDDAGCAGTFELIDSYVDRELSHGDAAQRYRKIALHLAVCTPCADDYRGLLSLAR